MKLQATRERLLVAMDTRLDGGLHRTDAEAGTITRLAEAYHYLARSETGS